MERWLSAGLRDDLAEDLLDCPMPAPEPPITPPADDLEDIPLVTLDEDPRTKIHDGNNLGGGPPLSSDWPMELPPMVRSLRDPAFRARMRDRRRARQTRPMARHRPAIDGPEVH